MTDRRMVVSGIGMATPFGGREATWRAVREGRSCLRWEKGAGAWVGRAAVRNYNTIINRGRRGAPGRANGVPPPPADPAAELAIQACREAWEQACLAGIPPERIGVLVSASKPNPAAMDGSLDWESFLPDRIGRRIAAEFRLGGPVSNIIAACATGLVSILQAARWVQEGRCDAVLAGGAESSLHPLVLAGFRRMGVLANGTGEFFGPFDRRRAGFGVSEGAAVVVLEEEDRARRRGIAPIVRLTGFSWRSDASHPTRFDSPETIAHLLRAAMSCAGAPISLGYINAHGTGTSANDPLEAEGIRRALGENFRRVPVSSTKGSTGHLLGAAGSAEFAFCCLALRDRTAPPTACLSDPDPACLLRHVREPEPIRPGRAAATISLGFGGHAACAVLHSA